MSFGMCQISTIAQITDTLGAKFLMCILSSLQAPLG